VVPETEADPAAVVVHDPANPDPSQQFAISRLDGPDMAHVPVGIFRDVQRPTYDDQVREQVSSAVTRRGGAVTDDDLATLIAGRDTWTVGA
jgi:2-oxoglutarate ferredoxin oxidoreductase subunit beta